MQMRSDMLAGRLEMYIGAVEVGRFAGFVDGYQYCCGRNGIPNERFEAFSEWLRTVKGEFPVEGWEAKYLRDCGGDPLAAIQKYLDFVAEFVGQEAALKSP
jgi:hypothetical protein